MRERGRRRGPDWPAKVYVDEQRHRPPTRAGIPRLGTFDLWRIARCRTERGLVPPIAAEPKVCLVHTNCPTLGRNGDQRLDVGYRRSGWFCYNPSRLVNSEEQQLSSRRRAVGGIQLLCNDEPEAEKIAPRSFYRFQESSPRRT